MGDFITEDVCFHTSTEGEKGERRLHAPPFSAKGKAKAAPRRVTSGKRGQRQYKGRGSVGSEQSKGRAYVGGHEGAARDSIEAGAPYPGRCGSSGPSVRPGRRGGKPRPDYCLPNLTPWSLSVVSIRCSAFKARFDAGTFML
jgi:hypothetical protein